MGKQRRPLHENPLLAEMYVSGLDLPRGPRAVLGQLALRLPNVRPSIEFLAKQTGYNKRTVIRYLKWLETQILIAVERRAYGAGGRGHVNTYTLLCLPRDRSMPKKRHSAPFVTENHHEPESKGRYALQQEYRESEDIALGLEEARCLTGQEGWTRRSSAVNGASRATTQSETDPYTTTPDHALGDYPF